MASTASNTSLPGVKSEVHTYATAPQFSELSHILPKTESEQKSLPGSSPLNSTPVLDSAAKKGHLFDSSPAHPYDQSIDLPPLDLAIPEPKRIDVAARREWLNRLLYYISELGIKKALYVPLTEGYIPTVKPSIDRIMGR
jgi:hypothetical protein